MTFSDIVGHQKQLATLRWALEKDRLHHAYFFLGPEGVGKRTVALSLAMAIQCREREYDSCGGCANCRQVQSGNHPDVRVVAPLAGKKEISIQQVRELERELNYRAFSGRKKIALVDPASLMNFSAQNALLKTLEEPPKESLLILLSTSTGAVLPTLLSRCLRLSFSPLPAEVVASFLVAQKGMKQQEAELLAAMTMGSLGKAVSPETQELVARTRVWAEKIGSLTRGDCGGWMTLAEELASAREDALKFLEWVKGWYRDILIYRVTESSRGISNLAVERDIKQQANLYTRERLLFLLSRALQAEADIRRNVNRRMALENFFAHVAGLR